MDMDRNALAAALRDACATTFENMAFMSVEPVDPSEDVELAPPLYYATISFANPVTGSLTLILPPALAEDILTALFGTEGYPAPESQTFDTIAELANTVAGQFLAAIVGTDRTFCLGLPKTGSGTLAPEEGAVVLRLSCNAEHVFEVRTVVTDSPV